MCDEKKSDEGNGAMMNNELLFTGDTIRYKVRMMSNMEITELSEEAFQDAAEKLKEEIDTPMKIYPTYHIFPLPSVEGEIIWGGPMEYCAALNEGGFLEWQPTARTILDIMEEDKEAIDE